MDIGIDSHAAEREGEGNATYTRHLVRGLLPLAGARALTLFGADARHPFYASLAPASRLRVRPVAQGRGLARVAWSLARAAARADVDCLHVQYFAPLRPPRPVVVTVHDLGFLHLPASYPLALRAVMRAYVPWSVARAAHVVTVSEFTRRDVIEHCHVPPARVTAIPLAADERFRPLAGQGAQTLRRYGLEPGFLFAVGRLDGRKNLRRLLDAHALLRARGVSDRLLVIGGKPDHGAADVLRALRAAGPATGVRWVGLIPDADLPAFYAGASCFAFPSLFEGFGLPVLEAMASGCPVVASDRAALPEVAGDAGLLVNPERAEAIAAALARVLTEPGLADDLRARGLARSRRFSWAETARRTLEVLDQAARARTG